MAAATLPFTCPDGYLSGGEAFEQACAVLIPGYDKLLRRIHEPVTIKACPVDELPPADAGEIVVRRIASAFFRNPDTDADELDRATFTAVDPNEEARRLTDEDACDACRRSVERLMRNALADGWLTPYGRGPTGEMERLVIENPEVWRREGLLPGLDSVPDDILSPGPDMKGKPFFLKLSELRDFLAALRHELTGGPVAEPAAVAVAGASLPDEPPVAADDAIGSTRGQRETDAPGETEERTKRRGPPHQYDWDEGFQFMRQQLDRRGDPLLPDNAEAGWRSDADVVRAVADHIALPGEEPEDPPRQPDFRHAKRRVGPELEKWRSEQQRA
jgi:hypothetical protein